ncbi:MULTISPECIES: hypothetical protein [unclassified Treponema]|uniref:hypothetical protein n=1 Tax=unclassified Treponema TaxID=2638727 RepID=UPI000530114D|nr:MULTISPECIES: hypothetical protein [unclassified Treponema]AIW89638.1 hypothetical protein JO41_07415 [Treponema sp. OMZ 838]UTC50322.1 hypothetical protein E4N65_09570 [Treponema sp. OMZ 855]
MKSNYFYSQRNYLISRTAIAAEKHHLNKTAAAKRLKQYGAAEPTVVASGVNRRFVHYSKERIRAK